MAAAERKLISSSVRVMVTNLVVPVHFLVCILAGR